MLEYHELTKAEELKKKRHVLKDTLYQMLQH
jgi:uncharacterized protein YdcH (DUF465 family)